MLLEQAMVVLVVEELEDKRILLVAQVLLILEVVEVVEATMGLI
jgi:hypothetical protein